MNWLFSPIPAPSPFFFKKAREQQDLLTKPPGSLGVLEQIAIRMSSLQGTENPAIEKIWVSIFAADHGVAEESVSAFPQEVTVEMVKNFVQGGAAVNVLSRFLETDFEVIDVGLAQNPCSPAIISDRAGTATANFCHHPAMTEQQLSVALNAGRSAVDRALSRQAELFIGGEMGIANSTSASAVACALLNTSAEELAGAGTGLNVEQIRHKSSVIETALNNHKTFLDSPLHIMQYLGGFEIAALTGAYLYAAQCQLPVLVDGFITTVAALCACKINPSLQEWLFFGHCSSEKGHRKILQVLEAEPILDLNMCLGEASGALAAAPLLQMACRLHNEMATFTQAKISTQEING